ncbi:MAG: sulfatase [Phycisphaeraceae bacterium]
MKPLAFFLFAIGSSLISCQVPETNPSANGKRPPNIVIFIGDDLGDGDLACYGHKVLRTPHTSRLAAEGMRFDAAFLTISSCSPSRASILTGRYPHSTRAEDLHDPLPGDQKMISQYLRDAGYYTASIGKWHLGNEVRKQFDDVIECQAAPTAQNTVKLIKDRPKDKPFFLWVASTDPHRPYQLKTIDDPHKAENVVVPPYLPDHPMIRKELALYYDEVERFDACVGSVRAALEEAGELDNTIVIFMSDNGMPFPRAKTTLYDAGIRTPLIVRYPRAVPKGAVQKNLFSVVDLAPTLLAMAGVKHSTMQGESQAAMWFDAKAKGRDAVYAEANWHDFEQFTRAVRDDRFKLVRNYYNDLPLWNSVDSISSITWVGYMEMKKAGKLTAAQQQIFLEPRPREELYDTQADPDEFVNVANDPKYAADLARLQKKLDTWREQTDDALPKERKPDGWTREGDPLPHNQPWYDRWIKQGKKNQFETY